MPRSSLPPGVDFISPYPARFVGFLQKTVARHRALMAIALGVWLTLGSPAARAAEFEAPLNGRSQPVAVASEPKSTKANYGPTANELLVYVGIGVALLFVYLAVPSRAERGFQEDQEITLQDSLLIDEHGNFTGEPVHRETRDFISGKS